MTHDPRDDFDHPNLPPGHRLRRHALYRIARDQPAAPGHQASPEHQAAGDFASWVVGMQGALRGEAGSDVPCGSCTACCTASQFVHIGPDETDTLLHIPHALLFPAPRMPRGDVLLGYDERGRCPMLIDDECSIYEHRPRTCRTYDCRVFPAAGLRAGEEDDDKALIDRQTQRWRFTYPTADDRIRHDAVRAAAAYLDRHPEVFADGTAPTAATPRGARGRDARRLPRARRSDRRADRGGSRSRCGPGRVGAAITRVGVQSSKTSWSCSPRWGARRLMRHGAAGARNGAPG